MMKRRRTLEPSTPLHSAFRSRRASLAIGTGSAAPKSALRRTSSRTVATPVDNTSASAAAAEPPPELFGCSWKLHVVSPLYKFQYSDDALAEYGRSLTSVLEAGENPGAGVAVNLVPSDSSPPSVEARLELLNDIAYTEFDPDAIIISVSKSGTTSGHSKSRLLKAVLLSVGSESPLESFEFTSLPVLMVKGPVGMSNQLLAWLRQRFDCQITPMQLQPYELAWIATEWAAPDVDAEPKSQRTLELSYSSPPGITGIRSITVSIEPATMRELVTSILKAEDTKTVEGSQLLDAIESHMYSHFSIKLSSMVLNRVGTYAAYVGREGLLKLFQGNDSDNTLLVLLYITFLASKSSRP